MLEGDEVIWEPMPGKIVVQTSGGERITETGIVLLSDPGSRMGKVIAIYEPFLLDAGDPQETEAYVKVGDVVIFGRHSGVEVSIGRIKAIVLKEAEILTKVRLKEKDG